MTSGLRREHGYAGIFTRDQAEGAIPNGARIVKQNSEPGDSHSDGAQGVVLGSIASPPELIEKFGAKFAYFIEWDGSPRVAVGTVDRKVRQ